MKSSGIYVGVVEKFSKRCSRIINSLKQMNPILSLCIVFSLILALLYILSPDDSNLVFSNPHSSRFIWTPLIPILVGLIVTTAMFGSAFGEFNRKETLISCMCVSFSIVLSPQLATSTPIGPDGLYFAEASLRFRDFGSQTRATYPYFDHPLLLLIMQPLVTLFPDHVNIISSVLGISMEIALIYIIFLTLSQFPSFNRWGVFACLAVCGIITFYWNPMQFSAQLLALLMVFYVFYIGINPEGGASRLSYLVAFLLPICHLFAPIFFISALFFESIIRARTSKSALYLFAVSSFSFSWWNLIIARSFFEHQVSSLPEIAGSIIFSPLPFFAIFAFVIFFHLNLVNLTEYPGDAWLGGAGIHNISVLMGALSIVPILFIQDLDIGSPRFTPRLIFYTIIPIMTWSRIPVTKIIQKLRENDFLIYKTNIHALAAAFCIICASLSSFGHVNLASRTSSPSEDATGCWGVAEDHGVPALVTRTKDAMDDYLFEGDRLLHSTTQIAPLAPHYFFKATKIGDQSDFYDTSVQKDIVAIIMTSDLKEKMDRENFQYEGENWTTIQSYMGACEIIVRTNVLDNLDTSIPWDTPIIESTV